jgi:hypothetical protein
MPCVPRAAREFSLGDHTAAYMISHRVCRRRNESQTFCLIGLSKGVSRNKNVVMQEVKQFAARSSLNTSCKRMGAANAPMFCWDRHYPNA